MADVAPPESSQPGQTQPGGGGSKNTILIVGGIVLLIAVAVGAFFIGKAKGEDDIKSDYKPGQPKYEAIYNAGAQAGQTTGEAEGQATGEAQGESAGTTKGKKVGLEEGKQQGEVQGANDVFDAYSSWEPGSFYIVQIGEGTGGVNYTLASRTQMAEGEEYKLCQDDPSSICVLNR